MSPRFDGHRDGRPRLIDENERMAQLSEEHYAEQERIDNALDARYRDSPVDSAALAYVAGQQAAIAARLANHLDTFADCVCADRAAPVSEPVAPTPSPLGRHLTTDSSGVPSRAPLGPSSPTCNDGQEMSR